MTPRRNETSACNQRWTIWICQDCGRPLITRWGAKPPGCVCEDSQATPMTFQSTLTSHYENYAWELQYDP